MNSGAASMTDCELTAAGTSSKRQHENSKGEPPEKRLADDGRRLKTDLHWAAGKGDVGRVRELLEMGADTRARDLSGWTPVHLAMYYNNHAVAQLLVDADNGNDIPDDEGQTPLHCAIRGGYLEMMKQLVAGGADRCWQDSKGNVPLQYAMGSRFRGHDLEFLVDVYGNYDIVGGRRNTPLHDAAREGCESIAKMLLQSGVHPHPAKNKDGKYPLQEALEGKHDGIVRLILAACALKDVKMKWGKMKLRPEQRQHCMLLHSQYSEEVQRMGDTPVPGSTLSYRDVGRHHIRNVSQKLTRRAIEGAYDQLQDFPNYWELIAFRLGRAEERGILMDQCVECFHLLAPKLPLLPETCCELILSCLSEADMKNFITAIAS